MAFLLLKSLLLQKENQKRLSQEANGLRKRTNDEDDTRTCRVCGGQGELDIFSGYQERNIAEDMRLCSGVPVYMNDGFSKWLCSECHHLLQCAVKFRKMCRDSTGRLLQLNLDGTHHNKLANLKVKVEPHSYPEMQLNTHTQLNHNIEGGLNSEVEIKLDSEVEIKLDNEVEASQDNEVEASQDNEVEASQDNDVNSNNAIEINLHNKLKGSMIDEYIVYTDEFVAASSDTDSVLDSEILCIYCKGTFDRQMEYRQHLKSCLPWTEKKSKRLKKNRVDSHLCESCGKSFQSIHVLNFHRTIHKNVFPFKCNICPYRGKTLSLLRMHERTHKAEKNYVCPHCPSAFRTASNLQVHIRRHTDRQHAQCKICNKIVRNKHSLMTHTKEVHEAVPATCEICGARYKSRKGLRTHKRKVHNLTFKYIGRASYLRCQNEDTEATT